MTNFGRVVIGLRCGQVRLGTAAATYPPRGSVLIDGIGGDANLDAHVEVGAVGTDEGATDGKRLRGVARHGDPDEVGPAHEPVGWIELDPSGAGQIDLDPSMRLAAADQRAIAVADERLVVEIARDEARGHT